MLPFKCQICGNQASHKFTKLRNGAVEEVYYCKEHADQNNSYFPKSQDMQSVINAMLKNLLDSKEEGAVNIKHVEKVKVVEEPGTRCPNCGLTYAAYRKTLMLGCGACYDAFREYLLPELRRYHGATAHTGRRPGVPGNPRENRLLALVELRRRMDDSISREDYEEAARLRDQIRELEKDN